LWGSIEKALFDLFKKYMLNIHGA